jgi:Bacterial protein of unknown function (DUF899)/Glycosyl hydrolase family 53
MRITRLWPSRPVSERPGTVNRAEERRDADVTTTPLPPVVDEPTWRRQLDELRAREKAATRELDAIAAQRRRLPMVQLPDYTLQGPDGAVRLVDVFDGKAQLIVYHHMWDPGQEWQCPGCTGFTSQFWKLEFLDDYDARFVIVTQGPIEEVLAYKKRVGNAMDWYSTAGSSFGSDMGAPPGGGFGVNVFLRDGDTVYRILWPIGEINCPSGTSCGGWDDLAQLLKAGVAGAQAGNPAGHKLLVMMHYDQGGNNALSSAFYRQLVSLGVPFDVIGLSYYPFFHGPISAMRANVDELATQFHKPIVIAETQYSWTLANGNSPLGDSTGDFVWETSQLSPGYPASPGGQLSFVTDELSILAQVPDGLGAGLFYWAPDWIPGVPWEPGTGIGSPNVNLTLFDFGGAALPSIGIFQNPAGVCERDAAGSVPCTIGG